MDSWQFAKTGNLSEPGTFGEHLGNFNPGTCGREQKMKLERYYPVLISNSTATCHWTSAFHTCRPEKKAWARKLYFVMSLFISLPSLNGFWKCHWNLIWVNALYLDSDLLPKHRTGETWQLFTDHKLSLSPWYTPAAVRADAITMTSVKLQLKGSCRKDLPNRVLTWQHLGSVLRSACHFLGVA